MQLMGYMRTVPYGILSILEADSVINVNSKIIALSINLGFPNGIAIKPVAVIETKTINVIR